MQMREGLSDYPRHSGATMSYPSFAKLLLIYMPLSRTQKYLRNYFISYCKDVFLRGKFHLHLLMTWCVVLAVLVADKKVKPINDVPVLAE